MKTRILITALISACVGTTSFADVYGTDDLEGGFLNVSLFGFMDYNSRLGSADTFTTSTSIELDWDELTARFTDFSMDFDGDTYTTVTDYTSGPGQTKTITASVHLDPFSISADNFIQADLTPDVGGSYTVSNVKMGDFGPLMLSGLVDISGPTESTSMPFSLGITPWGSWTFPGLNAVDTSGYPDTIELNLYDGTENWLCSWNFDETTTLIDTVIDGVDVSITTGGGVNAYTTGSFELAQGVPEPSSTILLSLGAGIVVLIRKKRWR